MQIAGWRPTDTLTDSVNFRLLTLRGGEYFGSHPWMSQVVGGDGGALVLKGERGAIVSSRPDSILSHTLASATCRCRC